MVAKNRGKMIGKLIYTYEAKIKFKSKQQKLQNTKEKILMFTQQTFIKQLLSARKWEIEVNETETAFALMEIL